MLARLRTARPELETWTEQLRAWLAADLLQPLVRLLNGTHKVRICKRRHFMFLGTPVGKPDLCTLRRACSGAVAPTRCKFPTASDVNHCAVFLCKLSQCVVAAPAAHLGWQSALAWLGAEAGGAAGGVVKASHRDHNPVHCRRMRRSGTQRIWACHCCSGMRCAEIFPKISMRGVRQRYSYVTASATPA